MIQSIEVTYSGNAAMIDMLLKNLPLHKEGEYLKRDYFEGENSKATFYIDQDNVKRIINAINKYKLRNSYKKPGQQLVAERVLALKEQGKSYREIATTLNKEGIPFKPREEILCNHGKTNI